jgi:hypothetical protein
VYVGSHAAQRNRTPKTAPIAQEGHLGFWRWTSIFLGISGTYRQDDWVDVVYERDGQRTVTPRLPIALADPRGCSPAAVVRRDWRVDAPLRVESSPPRRVT